MFLNALHLILPPSYGNNLELHLRGLCSQDFSWLCLDLSQKGSTDSQLKQDRKTSWQNSKYCCIHVKNAFFFLLKYLKVQLYNTLLRMDNYPWNLSGEREGCPKIKLNHRIAFYLYNVDQLIFICRSIIHCCFELHVLKMNFS